MVRSSLVGLFAGLILAATVYIGVRVAMKPIAAPTMTLQTTFTYSCVDSLQLGRQATCRLDYFPAHPTSTNEFVHAQIVANGNQIGVTPVEDIDIHLVPAHSSMSWILEPRVSGTIDYTVKYTQYSVDKDGSHRVLKIEGVTKSLHVTQPLLPVVWVQTKPILLVLIPALGTVIGALVGRKSA